jgi:hypothetical protein
MSYKRYRTPFWRRTTPLPKSDILKLRPSTSKKGNRFETKRDAQIESERSELLLKQAGGPGRAFAKMLANCREGGQNCDQPFCPLCARVFRRWYVGELLRIAGTASRKPITVFTVLLKKAQHDRIDELDLEKHRDSLRKRLLRAGLHDAITIGGYENLYRARAKEWVLHINLVIIGGTKAAIDKFQVSFSDADIERPVMKMAANDLPKQLSYVLKFTTYHRPYRQRGAVKSPARPLNVAEHLALVRWMAERNFRDFVFLFNARRSVDSIVPHKSRD